MHRLPNPTLGRRALIRNGALTVSLGALAAACGSGRQGGDAPGRLGVADAADDLFEEEIDDITLMRTAQSAEYTALAVYAAAAEAGALSSDELTVVQRFVDDHQRHADDIGAIVVRLGGEPFTCANPFMVRRHVEPMLAALDGSEDLRRDLLNISYAFESWAGATYQDLAARLMNQPLRVSAMQIGAEEQRHAAAVAAVLNPDTYVSPTLHGGQDESDDRGIVQRYAIPSVFAQVSGVELTVGAVNEEGSRYSTQLQTPAANSLVYSNQSC